MTEKTYPYRFFGEHVTLQESFTDEDNIEYAYYIGETIAVFRQTDLDNFCQIITLVKFDKNVIDDVTGIGGDFGNAAKKVYNKFTKNVRHDFVAAN